jgi:hypothetical protein
MCAATVFLSVSLPQDNERHAGQRNSASRNEIKGSGDEGPSEKLVKSCSRTPAPPASPRNAAETWHPIMMAHTLLLVSSRYVWSAHAPDTSRRSRPAWRYRTTGRFSKRAWEPACEVALVEDGRGRLPAKYPTKTTAAAVDRVGETPPLPQ